MLTYAHHNQLICSSAAFASPAAKQMNRWAFELLHMLPLSLQPMLLPRWRPARHQGECAAVLSFAQLTLGLVAPALVAATHEASLFRLHQRQRREAGLPAEAGWEAWLYERLAAVLVGAKTLPTVLLGLWATVLAWEAWIFFFY